MKTLKALLKGLVQAFFWAWALNQVLPPVLVEYRPFELFSRACGYMGNAMNILAIGLFMLTLIPRKQPPLAAAGKTTLILHDLEPETAQALFSHIPNAKFFCASPKMAPCRGYYDCWLKTPGTCALHDGFETLSQHFGMSDNLMIVSKNLYGGYSKEIKNAVDRSIAFALPFFKMVAWEVHHQERYAKRGDMSVYVYDSESISEADKNALRELAGANVRNFNKNLLRVEFVGDINEIRGKEGVA